MKIKDYLKKAASGNISALRKKLKEYRKTATEEEIRYDEDGNEYRKHAVLSRYFSYAKDSAFYKTSEIDVRQYLLITLFGGIFGLHFFIRGDYKNGLLYLLTFGGFGIFYVIDVISLCLGNYSYFEVDYTLDNDGNYERTKEKVYIKPFHDIRIKITAVLVSLILGFCSTVYICMPVYKTFNKAITDIASTGINAYIDQRLYDIQ